MAETSYNNNNNDGSPISNLAHDHLLTVLLCLPVDSVLSFSMTCRRFRSLASSDSLWESICRRDWGPKSVEAFKSSNQYRMLPWMRLYKQLCQLESVFCHKLSDPDGGLLLPNPRASHSLNFVSDCLVMFGGGCEGGRHLDDTCVAYIGNDFQRTLTWHKVSSGIPSGRFGHTCIVIDDHLILFGGINDRGNRHNDTWVGQVACHDHENLGMTLSWRLLEVGPVAPPPRGAHAACYIYNNRRMVIHGGMGLHGVRLGDTWVLELSENFCFGSWHEVVSSQPSPRARSGHSLTYIGGNRSVLFGGRGLGYEVLSDVWFLDVSTTCLKWVQILYDLQNVPQGGTLPRVGHSATLILGGRLLIYGGEDTYRHRKDDFWVLDTNAVQTQSSLNSKRLSQNMWKRLRAEGYKPKCRSFHRACADYSGRYLYVFGGMVDGLPRAAESSGLRFDGELLLVDLMPRL